MYGSYQPDSPTAQGRGGLEYTDGLVKSVNVSKGEEV